MDTGPIRTFGLYPTRVGQSVNEQTGLDILTQIYAFERRRGAVLSAQEEPLLVKEFFVQETEQPKFSFLSWKHLKHGLDQQRLIWGGAIAAFGLFIYLLSRALGWIIDGFVSRQES